jgi:hypothetical protein
MPRTPDLLDVVGEMTICGIPLEIVKQADVAKPYFLLRKKGTTDEFLNEKGRFTRLLSRGGTRHLVRCFARESYLSLLEFRAKNVLGGSHGHL